MNIEQGVLNIKFRRGTKVFPKFDIRYSILVLFLILPLFSIAQSEEDKPKNYTLNGYIKNLQSIYRITLFGDPVFAQDNLLHNRLNFKWFINENFTFRSDLRNRVFYGDRSIFLANFDEDAGNDFLDLSVNFIHAKGLLFHSMIDRLYLEYVKGSWEIRLGRQRINWGINTVWNPHDIFNAYNFADFDYEERPGSDALRLTYYTGVASSVELAVKAANSLDSMVVGGLWKFNKWNYDFQILTGYFQNDLALGAGWAGNIKNASFKGEVTYFVPLVDENESGFAATFAVDYAFNKGLYLNVGFLYNSLGVTMGGLESLFTAQLSAKNLYPFKYSIFVQASYPITPLMNIGIANIFSPSDANALFFNPTFSYSIAQNWDLNIVGQLLFNQGVDKYESPVQGFFVRFKYSF